MSPELAALLNTKVTARFGRPTRDGFSLGSKFWTKPNESKIYHEPAAAALWESHLLDQCGERPDAYWGTSVSWEVQMYKATNPDYWWAIIEYDGTNIASPKQSAAMGSTRLEALATAMLAVPEPINWTDPRNVNGKIDLHAKIVPAAGEGKDVAVAIGKRLGYAKTPPPTKPAMPECVRRVVDVLQSVALAKFPELCGTPAETKINAAIAAVRAYYAQPTTEGRKE